MLVKGNFSSVVPEQNVTSHPKNKMYCYKHKRRKKHAKQMHRHKKHAQCIRFKKYIQ